MMAGDPFAEWCASGRLRQADIDRLLSAGVPAMSIATGPDSLGFPLALDRIVPQPASHRFEFHRHDEVSGEGCSALVVLALDASGEPVDLVAFRSGQAPFVGSWLGRAGLLGEEQLYAARFGDPLTVHADPMHWLRAERRGVCVVDPARAAPMLRDCGTIEVGSHAERRRLIDAMTIRLPRITVRPAVQSAAA